MSRHVLVAASAMSLACLASVPAARAGLCFCWEDNASRSDCNAAIADEAACQQHCSSLGYARHFFNGNGTAACEGSEASGGGAGNLPVTYEPDANDLDNDATTTTIRWRYVMVIDNCETTGDICREKHQLWRCWCDDTHT
jgi:hypothetical protein